MDFMLAIHHSPLIESGTFFMVQIIIISIHFLFEQKIDHQNIYMFS